MELNLLNEYKIKIRSSDIFHVAVSKTFLIHYKSFIRIFIIINLEIDFSKGEAISKIFKNQMREMGRGSMINKYKIEKSFIKNKFFKRTNH